VYGSAGPVEVKFGLSRSLEVSDGKNVFEKCLNVSRTTKRNQSLATFVLLVDRLEFHCITD
jgi:hypothetical protein